MGMENFSLSDVASVVGNKESMGGNWMWIIILFLFIFGGQGFGQKNQMGGADAYVTVGQFEQAQNFNTLNNKLSGLENAFSQLGFSVTNQISTEGRGLSTQLANCCCETNRNIDSVKLEGERNTQKILDAIVGNRFADMQNTINQLQLQAALCGVVRYPQATTYCSGANPFGSGCGTSF